ncbi:unnamed protein product, partial [Porites lobata]
MKVHLVLVVIFIAQSSGQINFIQIYDGKDVFGVVGSSINFTWYFSNGVETVTWGLKDSVSSTVDLNKKLISIGLQGQLPLTPPQAYVGRVS